MSELRIGIVTQSYYPNYGGVTEHVHHVALELGRRGHSVSVITGGPQRSEPCTSPRVLRVGRTLLVPSNGARANVTVGTGLSGWMKGLLRTERFDVVHCHCPLTPTLPLLAIRHAPCPVVGTFHASARSHLGYTLFRRLLRPYHSRLAGRVAVSLPARDFAWSYFGGDYRIIPNGVDLTRFSPETPPLEKYDSDKFNVLYVGRLDPRKGLPILLDSFHRLWVAEKTRVRLIIVGNGPLYGHLRRSVPGELKGAVHFEGAVRPELLPHYYASSHVLCSPATQNESFGIVLLEAMASGVPVVASDIPGYRTAVKNGVHGLLVEPNSARSLARAMGLLARDESLRHEMARAGRENAKAFAWSEIAETLEAYFLEVLNGHGPRVSALEREPMAAVGR